MDGTGYDRPCGMNIEIPIPQATLLAHSVVYTIVQVRKDMKHDVLAERLALLLATALIVSSFHTLLWAGGWYSTTHIGK